MSDKELLFSVTAKDFDWDYFNASGPGGQNVNKNQCGVRCTHRASKARGQAADTKSRQQNQKLAFRRCVETKEFTQWHRIEIAKHMGTYIDLEKKVDEMMQPKNLKIETRKDNKWTVCECGGMLDEQSVNDDWDGTVTCNWCGTTKERYT